MGEWVGLVGGDVGRCSMWVAGWGLGGSCVHVLAPACTLHAFDHLKPPATCPPPTYPPICLLHVCKSDLSTQPPTHPLPTTHPTHPPTHQPLLHHPTHPCPPAQLCPASPSFQPVSQPSSPQLPASFPASFPQSTSFMASYPEPCQLTGCGWAGLVTHQAAQTKCTGHSTGVTVKHSLTRCGVAGTAGMQAGVWAGGWAREPAGGGGWWVVDGWVMVGDDWLNWPWLVRWAGGCGGWVGGLVGGHLWAGQRVGGWVWCKCKSCKWNVILSEMRCTRSHVT